jgi:hypothetical protein
MLVADHEVGVAVVPLNVMELVPLVDPKLLPVIVTTVPTGPPDGDRLVMTGPTVTVKVPLLLDSPPTFTTTLPVVAALGTGTTMLDADHDVGVAAVPLKVTVLLPLLAPKLLPVIVTAVLTGPLLGDKLVMVGAAVTVKVRALLARPPTATTTLPVAAPAGTGTTILEADHEVGDATVPLKVTVLVPLLAPKLPPLIVTAVAIGPLEGDRLVKKGDGITVNGSALARPPTVTTTLPLVAPAGTGTTMLLADHDVGVAAMPLKVTVPLPWLAPKLLPLIVTVVATGPLVGDRLVSVGTAITVYVRALLATPPTDTTTLPVVAPDGTVTTMLLADQVIGVAAMPLNVTVLVPGVAPKLLPLMVTAAAAGPLDGERLVSVGVGGADTVNVNALLARPPTVTTTLPVVAPVGTGTTMLVADQVVGVAAVPLKITVLVLWVEPKLLPVMVTVVATGPLAGERLVSVGATVTE